MVAALLALAACGGASDSPADAALGTAPPASEPAAGAPPTSPPASAPGTEPPASSPTGTTPVTTPDVADAMEVDHAAFGGAMSPADVEASFTRIGAFVDAWKASRTDLPSLTAETYAQALSAGLAGQADVRYINVSPTDFTVTVQLRDGSPYFFATRFAADGSPRTLRQGGPVKAGSLNVDRQRAGATSPAASRKAIQAVAEPGDPVLPAGKRAVFFNGFPTDAGHTAHHVEMRQLFASVGYAVETQTLTIDNLVSVGAVDILWIDTHAIDAMVRRAPLSDPVSTYVLAALAPRACAALTAQECTPYREMLDSGVAVWGGALWGISPRFVRNHLGFKSQRSLAVLDACETADPAPGPTAMRRAFQAVGAGLVYGWVHQVYAPTGSRVISDFFDAALGTNRYFKDVQPLSPFGVNDVFSYLDGKGLLKDDYPGDAGHEPGTATFEMSPLNLPPLAVAGLVLRPSIEDYVIVEGDSISRISILGLFGDVTGSVTVNGQHLINVTWTPWKIEADLPNAGAAVAGPLVVTSNGIASPPVPITLWQGRAELNMRLASTYGEPGFVATASCLASFRQNILETRPNLLRAPARDVLGAFELLPIASADLNRCTWDVTGEGRKGDVRTVAARAPSAVTPQSPPQFTNLRLGVLPGNQVLTAFAVPMPMRYTRYDKDGKKIDEGDLGFDFDQAPLVRGTVLSPAWRFDASFQGPLDTDPRDTASFEMHLAPQYVPNADTPR